MTWFAFQVKDFYDRPSQYRELRLLLEAPPFGIAPQDIYIPGGGDYANPLCRYVFVRLPARDSMALAWPELARAKYIKASDGYLEIPDSEMATLMTGMANRPKPAARYGDIVRIESTECQGLYGIVLGEAPEDRYTIGMNLFIGPRVAALKRDDFAITKSLFEIWKFPVAKTIAAT